MWKRITVIALAVLSAAGSAAAMPTPVKSVAPSYYSGRWYEIARTQSKSEHDCDGVTYDFAQAGETFNVALTCHKGSPTGPADVTKSTGKALDGSNGAKFKLTFLGVIPVEYWVLATAPDASWFIMARDNGKYVWIVARKPIMDLAQRTALVAQIGQMGIKIDNLEYPAPVG